MLRSENLNIFIEKFYLFYNFISLYLLSFMVTPIGKCILLFVPYSTELLNIIEQSCDNISDIPEIPDLEDVAYMVEGRDLKTLIVTSIETLKRSNKKCDKKKFAFGTRIRRQWDYKGALRRASKQVNKMSF